MSQFTFATLVKDNNQSITSFIEKDKASCYWFSVNPTWTAVIKENDTQLGSQTAEKMSDKLATSAFFFLHAEDLTWGYSFFHRGQLVSECYVNYEEKSITIQNVNEAALLEACVDHEAYHEFKQWQSNFYQDEHDILNGVHLFKKAFAIEKIEWISYDYLSSGSDERIDQLQMQYYQGKKKSIPVKRMIFDSLQEPFNQIGFFLDEGMSSRNWFAFSKEDEHGYKYAIIIDATTKGEISASIYSPSVSYIDIFRVVLGEYREAMRYENEDELRRALEEIRTVFVNEGQKWFLNNQIEVFDVNGAYEEIMTPYLQDKGFHKVHEDSPLVFGGKLIFKNEKVTIIFEHFPKLTGVQTHLVWGDDEITLTQFVHINRRNPQFQEKLKPIYTNKEEFIAFLARAKKFLEIYLEHIS